MKRYLRRLPELTAVGLLFILGVIFALEVYTIVVQGEGDAPLPPLFGNFPANRAALEDVQEEGEFTFAVVGDTKSVGTFERITAELRRTPLDFAVLLGDCTYDGSQPAHRYFRAECADEYALPFPVFYVVGNHDVSPDQFPISRFEDCYGPSIFSFEHRQSLFIVLRVLNEPFTNVDSLAFLERLRQVDLGKYHHTFAFIHIPPPVSPAIDVRPVAEAEQFAALFEELPIEYVFAGDFHGYAQCRRRDTTYVVTGGGGAHLATEPGGQHHHATVVRVTPDAVDARIVFVPPAEDLEDRLEKFAIMEVWPWMQQYTAWARILNALAVVLWVFMAWSLLRKVRSHGSTA